MRRLFLVVVLAAAAAVLLLMAASNRRPVSQPPEPAPDQPIALKVDPESGTPGAIVTVTLRVLKPERIARREADGSFLGWICFRACGGDGASSSTTFTPVPGAPGVFTAEVTVPIMLRRNAGPGTFDLMDAGEYRVHAACVLDQAGGCAGRSEVSTTFRVSAGPSTVAWQELPRATAKPVQILGARSTTSHSPLPGSQRSVECVSGNLDPQSGEAPPKLMRTDDAGRPLPPVVFSAGGPLFGRHGYAGCADVALDPFDTDVYYVLESPHAGGAEPGAFPWPQFTRDRGVTWAPVPAPAGFDARRTFFGFTVAADGVTAWFSRANLEERDFAGEQIQGSFTGDGGQSWTTVAPPCPDTSAVCLWQLRDQPPVLRSGLIRSADGGKSWSWAALSGIPFAADAIYVLEGSGGKVLEAVSASPSLYWGFMPLLRSEDGGATWQWVDVPTPPGGWIETAGAAPLLRLDPDGALVLGRSDGAGPTRWFRLAGGSADWAQPAAPPNVVRAEGQVLVPGLTTPGGPHYVWSPDGSRVAFQQESGIWSLSPDGSMLEALVTGPAHRELVGWTAEAGLVYLEARPEGTIVAAVWPGHSPRVVATLAEPQLGVPGRFVWRFLSGHHLLVAEEGRPVWRIELADGNTRVLTEESLPVLRGDFAVSPDGRFLAYKNAHRADAVRILDLDTGTVTGPTGDEFHLPGVAWSPAGTWAVRSAEAGSGLPVVVGANAVEGATHLDLGDAAGNLRHLRPLEPLQLVAGPWWSPDGRWLAVTAGVLRGLETGGMADLRGTEVWLVEADSGRWRKLGDLDGGWVSGWHPDGRHLLVQWAAASLESWPVEGGAARARPHPWNPDQAVELAGGGFVYLTPALPYKMFIQRGGGEPVQILGGAGHKSDLTVRDGYAAVVVWPDGEAPKLALVPLP